LVRHFPGFAFSSPEIWSVIFQVLHFPVFDLFWSVIFRSCKFSAPDLRTPGGTSENFGETRGGIGKSGMLENKSGNISERVKIEEKLLWTAYRNSQTLFRTVPSPTPYGLPLCGHSQGQPQFVDTPC